MAELALLEFIDSYGGFIKNLGNIEESVYSEWKKSNNTKYLNWIYKNIPGVKKAIVVRSVLRSIEFESENYLTLFLLEYGS